MSICIKAILARTPIFIGLWLFGPEAQADLDLAAARQELLGNGLTVIVLEDDTFPLVSVQMLYRVGARNEPAGATGLAHFLEHMAFRSAQNFPGTQLVSSIDAVGGEWHGYTWLDQTTYFATVPAQELDLLLRIESDRMARLDIPEDAVPAERGAVLAEMHGYENDPKSVLHDHVLYLSFLAHPYRNNTIGWESDVTAIDQSRLVSFYRQHYQPGNAVLAIVGDIQADQVIRQVQHYFGRHTGKAGTPAPPTVEPKQRGERRIQLQGAVERQYFQITYHAPAVLHSDYAAFLVTQDLLAGGSGVSFLQNDWGTPVRTDAPMSGISDDLTSWFPPAAQDYVFSLSGSAPLDAGQDEIEHRIESKLQAVRQQIAADGTSMAAALQQAKQRIQRELVLDIQTTEDAAHQLAFFSGLNALDTLRDLPQAVNRITTADIARVMGHYLQAQQRTIGWLVPAAKSMASAADSDIAPAPITQPPTAEEHTLDPPDKVMSASNENDVMTQTAKSSPMITKLLNGTPVIIQYSDLSPTLGLKILTPAATFPPEVPATQNEPLWGMSAVDFIALPSELTVMMDRASTALASSAPLKPQTQVAGSDPTAVLTEYIKESLGLVSVHGPRSIVPILLVVSGAVGPEQVLPLLQARFGNLSPATRPVPPAAVTQQKMDIETRLSRNAAQEQLAYVVRAPGPAEPDAVAWQLLLYILSHGYEGRLGLQAINRMGLVYYIDSSYQSDGHKGWITLTMGVDPDKLPAMKALLRAELLRLLQQPPSQQELDEARQHMLGRKLSANQSNAEITTELARQWMWYGQLLDYKELQHRLAGVSRQDLVSLLPAFTGGTTIAVRNPAPH